MAIDLRKRFGTLLSANRRRRAMTQSQLAEAAGLSVDMVARLESGNTGARFSTIEKLSQALDIDAAQLFTADIPESALKNPKLSALTVKLSKLSDADLEWLDRVLPTLMTRR